MARTHLLLPIFSAMIFAVILIFTFDSVRNTPLLPGERAEEHALALAIQRNVASPYDGATFTTLSGAYWRCYPDVAEDNHYGKSGRLSAFGAYEHYLRHGREEGRAWGSALLDRCGE